jgi:hypothetical protein
MGKTFLFMLEAKTEEHPLGEIFLNLLLENIDQFNLCGKIYHRIDVPYDMFFNDFPDAKELEEEALRKVNGEGNYHKKLEISWAIRELSQNYIKNQNNRFR